MTVASIKIGRQSRYKATCPLIIFLYIFLYLVSPANWKLSISPLRYNLVHYILLAIPDTLFFQPAFPFSDYCLKRRKVQSATDRPKKSY